MSEESEFRAQSQEIGDAVITREDIHRLEKAADGILMSFEWLESKRGEYYWNTVHDQLQQLIDEASEMLYINKLEEK